jgi:hypothetical protein
VTFESTTPEPLTPVAAREDVVRGALFALLVVPAGVIVWGLIWSIGFIASIVAFGVAIAALWLYRIGARGAISKAGALVVTGITAATLLLAFFAGIVLDGIRGVAEASGLGWLEVAVAPEFWQLFWAVLPSALGDYTLDFLLALAFGALGCFTVLRSAFAQAKQVDAPAAPAEVLPESAGIVDQPAPVAEERHDEEGAPEAR